MSITANFQSTRLPWEDLLLGFRVLIEADPGSERATDQEGMLLSIVHSSRTVLYTGISGGFLALEVDAFIWDTRR